MTTISERLSAAFGDDFMQPVIYTRASYWEVETTHGTEIFPLDVVGNMAVLEDFADYCEGRPISFEQKTGYLARVSAPGYMDCTEWAAFDTAEEAADYLIDTYADDTDEGDSE